MRRVVMIAAIGAALPACIDAQPRSASLVGWLRDTAGNAVTRADVHIDVMKAWARTDSTGFFRLRGLDPGKATIAIRRLGFDPQTFEFALQPAREDTVAVTLQVNAQVLEAMRIDAGLERRYDALTGFYERRARGSGMFLTRDEIESRHASQLSDALRELPGLLFSNGRRGRGLRFQSAANKRTDCPPDYWIDGRRLTNTDVDDYPTNDIEAVELYAGASSTPAQFGQSAARFTCGTIIIWTRIPGLP